MSSPAPSERALLKTAIDEQRDAVLRLLDDRFAELAARVEQEFQAELDRSLQQARRETAVQFNSVVRRLAAAENQEQWAAAVVDSSAAFAARAALLAPAGEMLEPLRARGGELPAGLLPLSEAPGIKSAIESRETTVAISAASELSAPLAALFEDAERAIVIPVIARDQVIAVLIAAGEPFDMNGLEALGALAGAAHERLGRPSAETAPLAGPYHLRAQRFARVRVAEIRLYKSRAVRAGRAARNLYAELKEEIDSARDVFQRDYLSKSDSLPDYLHLELVRTLANDDAALLGEDYPGPLA